MVALRSTAVNYSLVGEKPYDLVYGGLWKACIVKGGSERCEALLTGQGMILSFLVVHFDRYLSYRHTYILPSNHLAYEYMYTVQALVSPPL